MTDTIRAVLVAQYLAALEMLRRAVAACPANLWDTPAAAAAASTAESSAGANSAAAPAPRGLAAAERLSTPARKVVAAAPQDGVRAKPFWRVAIHTLWYTDLYLSPSLAAFTPWPKHHNESQCLGPLHPDGSRPPRVGPPRSPAEVLEFADYVAAAAPPRVAASDLAGPSGFWWLPFTKLELHVYNTRHVQHHAATLIARLRERAGVEVDWVGTRPADGLESKRDPNVTLDPK